MDNFSMIRNLNMMLKSYEIVYIFVNPSSLPLTRRYLISENVAIPGWLPIESFWKMQKIREH